jgi:hypothetical protein
MGQLLASFSHQHIVIGRYALLSLSLCGNHAVFTRSSKIGSVEKRPVWLNGGFNEGRHHEKTNDDMQWQSETPTLAVQFYNVPLASRSMTTFVASDHSSLEYTFFLATDTDVIDVSADITLTSMMCIIFFYTDLKSKVSSIYSS